MNRVHPLLPGLLILFVVSVSQPCPAASLEEAIALSKNQGDPLFVVVTGPYCVPCKVLKHRLETEEPIRKLLDGYVGIHFDQSDPAYETWIRKYPPRGNAVPMLFIVSSTGRLIYNDSGAPRGDQLAQILKEGLRENAALRKAASQQGWRKRKEAVSKAAKLIDSERYAEAIRTLKPHFKAPPQTPAAGDIATNPSVAELKSRLQQRGRAELDSARQYIASDEKRLFGLLALAKTRRLFADLPEVADEIDGVWSEIRQNERHQTMLEQVDLIDRGRAAEQSGDYAAAATCYREVMDEHPDSLAAKLCSVRVHQIRGAERVEIAAEPTTGVFR
jgi:hypothetical protein